MRPPDLPFLRGVFESGPDDRVFDGLLLTGPVVVLLIVVAGRSVVTSAIAATYLLVIVGYILYQAVA